RGRLAVRPGRGLGRRPDQGGVAHPLRAHGQVEPAAAHRGRASRDAVLPIRQEEFMMRFAGRTAVVTGAGSGIGFEMARLLLEEGATVIAADLDPASVPDGAVGVKADVSQVPDVEAMIRTA